MFLLKKLVVIFIFFIIILNFLYSQNTEITSTDKIAIILIMDESGSMRWNDPNRLRIEAAQLFLDLTGEGDELAIIGFGEKARLISSFKTIQSNKAELINSIQQIKQTDQFTDIKSALELAWNIRNNVKNKKIISILMSDGEVSQEDLPKGTDINSYFNALFKLCNNFEKNNIPIYTIGFTPHADNILLRKIAVMSGGANYFAKSPKDLLPIFNKLIKSITIPIIMEKYIPLNASPEQKRVKIDKSVSQLVVTVEKESANEKPNIRIIDEKGQEIQGERRETKLYSIVKINNPSKGNLAVNINRGRIIKKLNLEMKIVLPKKHVFNLNEIIKFKVLLTSLGEPLDYSPYKIKGLISRPNGQTDEIHLFDDGQHNDNDPQDGIFCGTYAHTNLIGNYSCILIIYTGSGTNETSSEKKLEFVVRDILPVSLEISNTSFIDQPVLFFATLERTNYSIDENKILLEVLNPNKAIEIIELLDNGTYPDKEIGDNIFTGALTKLTQFGKYKVNKIFYYLKGERYEISSQNEFSICYKFTQLLDKIKIVNKQGAKKDITLGTLYNHCEKRNFNIDLFYRTETGEYKAGSPQGIKIIKNPINFNINKTAPVHFTLQISKNVKPKEHNLRFSIYEEEANKIKKEIEITLTVESFLKWAINKILIFIILLIILFFIICIISKLIILNKINYFKNVFFTDNVENRFSFIKPLKNASKSFCGFRFLWKDIEIGVGPIGTTNVNLGLDKKIGKIVVKKDKTLFFYPLEKGIKINEIEHEVGSPIKIVIPVEFDIQGKKYILTKNTRR